MRTRYRIMFDGHEYKIQRQFINNFWYKFGKLKRSWKDLIRYHEFGEDVRTFSTIDFAKNFVNDCKIHDKEYAIIRKSLFKIKKQNPSGWIKVWP